MKIYYSSRIENLAEDLRDRLANERKGGDPFVFSQVVVPNTNIAKWLQMRVFAKTPALCAGIRFPFMEHRLTELLSRNLPSDKPFSLLPDGIVSLFPEIYKENYFGVCRQAPFLFHSPHRA